MIAPIAEEYEDGSSSGIGSITTSPIQPPAPSPADSNDGDKDDEDDDDDGANERNGIII